jgi:hypothetical protein
VLGGRELRCGKTGAEAERVCGRESSHGGFQ